MDAYHHASQWIVYMPEFKDHQAIKILLLLLSGVVCVASIIPFLSVYIVQTLGKDPWMISLYTVVTLILTVVINRQYGEWIDAGTRISLLILTSIIAFALAISSILLVPNYWLLVIFASPCFAIANAAVSTMYSFGRLHAEREGLNITRYNSYLRSMTSLGWMIAPAIAFFIAGAIDVWAVFKFALALSGIWMLLWWWIIPKDFTNADTSEKPSATVAPNKNGINTLWLAAGVCLAFAMAHTMTMAALPLFYIQEVNLPTFAPGLSFTVKTGVEIVAILLSPLIISHFGARASLIAAALLAICAFYVLSNVTTIQGLIFGAALEGLYYGTFAAVGLTFVQDFANGRMARATSLYMNSLFMGGLIASPLMGLTAQFFSFQMSIQLSSVWAVAAILLLIYMSPKRTGK